jgi:hypothetical protein
MLVVINGMRVGRLQGLRYSAQGSPRPVTEVGTDRNVEFVPGIKQFQGSIQTIMLRYGPIIKRLASMSGAVIDPDSVAATLSNFPEFNIEVYDRGNPDYNSPALYAPTGNSQDLTGSGKLAETLIGCVIETFDKNLNANEALIMESVSFKFIDVVLSPDNNGNKDFSPVLAA